MEAIIEACCKQLKIGRVFYQEYKKIEADSHEAFLLELLKMEIEHRQIVRKNRLVKNANFDVIKTFNNYDFDELEIPVSLTLEDLKSASIIEKKENLIIYGGVGAGKSHLATAIGVEACNQGRKVRFYRTAALVNQLTDAKAHGDLRKFMKQISQCDLLICDEWGFIPFDKEGAQLLFQVISECYERRSVIITTNLKFSDWNTIFYDEIMTAAIIDRLIHHSYLILAKGSSKRLRNSTINC